MTDNDMQRFFELWTSVADMHGKQVDDKTLKLVFRLLQEFPIESIELALEQHVLGDTGQFMPKPADLAVRIRGVLPSADEIIGLARACNTPVGCFARMIIGKWDLDNMDSYYLRQRGEEVKAEMPEFIRRARAGQYTQGEIRMMKGRNINLAGELCPGLPGPDRETGKRILAIAAKVPAFLPPAESAFDNPVDSKQDAERRLSLVHSGPEKK